MALDTNKQVLANLIQLNELIIKVSRSGYKDEDLKEWLVKQTFSAQERISDIKKNLEDTFSIDYDSEDSKKEVIKEGSIVKVLVNHMDGMKNSDATVLSYSIPAMLSDITMSDGMKMNKHKWLTNNEVELK